MFSCSPVTAGIHFFNRTGEHCSRRHETAEEEGKKERKKNMKVNKQSNECVYYKDSYVHFVTL